MMVDPTGFWGDGFWGDEPAALLRLSAMGLVLAVCALGVAIILVVAVNEWRLWRQVRHVDKLADRPRSETAERSIVVPGSWQILNLPDPRDAPVTFEWDWPAA